MNRSSIDILTILNWNTAESASSHVAFPEQPLQRNKWLAEDKIRVVELSKDQESSPAK